jgi:hypothetical protein
MQALRWANAVLAFGLEFALLAAFAFWGFTADDDLLVRCALGLGAPALVIVIWAVLLAPMAKRRLPMPWLAIAKLVLFGLGALALYIANAPGLALALAVLAVVNIALTAVLGEPSEISARG